MKICYVSYSAFAPGMNVLILHFLCMLYARNSDCILRNSCYESVHMFTHAKNCAMHGAGLSWTSTCCLKSVWNIWLTIAYFTSRCVAFLRQISKAIGRRQSGTRRTEDFIFFSVFDHCWIQTSIWGVVCQKTFLSPRWEEYYAVHTSSLCFS